MTTLSIINAILIFYVIPAMIVYMCTRWLHIYYYKSVKPTFVDVFMVMCPIVNLIVLFAILFEVSDKKSMGFGKNGKASRSFGDVFFGVNKKED